MSEIATRALRPVTPAMGRMEIASPVVAGPASEPSGNNMIGLEILVTSDFLPADSANVRLVLPDRLLLLLPVAITQPCPSIPIDLGWLALAFDRA